MRLRFEGSDEDAFRAAQDVLVEEFAAATGEDGWVVHQLLHHKWGYLEGDLARWTIEDLAEILLELFPRKVIVDDGDAAHIIPEVRAFLRWLHERHGLARGSDPLPVLLDGLDRMAGDVVAAVHDPGRFGMAKALFSQMAADGVSPDDPDAVTSWIAAFNDRSFEERLAATSVLDRDDEPPEVLPPLVPVPAEELAAAVEAAPLFGWLRELVAFVASGRRLTQTGNLALADGRELAARIGPSGGRVQDASTVRSSADLQHVDLVFRWARRAGFLKVRSGRVEPTKRARDLTTRPVEAWLRSVEGLLELGLLGHRYTRRRYLVPPWKDDMDEAAAGMLIALYVADAPVPVEELAAVEWDGVLASWNLSGLSEADLERWREHTGWDLRYVLERLEQLGVVAVRGVEVVQERGWKRDAGGDAVLTPAGRVAVHRIAVTMGFEAPVAGQLAHLGPATLLERLAAGSPEEAGAEAHAWAAAHAGEGHEKLVAALLARPPDPRVSVPVVTALTARDDAEAAVRLLCDDALHAPMAAGWLIEHGLDAPAITPHDAVVTMAWCGGRADAVMALEGAGDVEDQIAALGEARRRSGPLAAPLLDAIADLHADANVRKAARKERFRLASGRR